MAIFNKTSGTQGAWVKNSEVVSGTKCKLVSEAVQQEGQFGTQIVGKLRFKGDEEAKNANINSTSVNALIEAFGPDSVGWQGNILTAVTEKSTIAQKRVTILYLIPDGFELGEDDGGYVQIRRIGSQPKKNPEIPVVNVEDNIQDSDLPF